MRSRALTQTLSRPELTFLVEEFRCQSHSLTNQIGAKAAHRKWRVGVLGHGRDDLLEKSPVDQPNPPEKVAVVDSVEDNETHSNKSPPTPSTAAASNEHEEAASHEQSVASRTFDRDTRSVCMEVITDMGIGGVKAAALGTQVTINADGEQLFPKKTLARSKLHDDWTHEWKYRGNYPGVGLVRPGEAWISGTIPTDVPSQVGDTANLLQTYLIGDGMLNTMHQVQLGDTKFPAVLTKQLANGCFDVVVFKPNTHYTQGVAKYMALEFPAMSRSNIFLTATSENVQLPDSSLCLQVSRVSPHNASLHISGESFLNYLGRPSPNSSSSKPPRIMIDCPKQVVQARAKQVLQQGVLGLSPPVQEKPVQINAQTSVFTHFLSGEIRRGHTDGSRLQRSWTLQLGPFATHTVRLVKKSHASAIMTLYVDDEVLVECLSTDLGGSRDVWRCKFALVGERQMTFRVHEESKDGWPSDSRCEMTKSFQYRHEVEVAYSHRAIDNLVDAALQVDSNAFNTFPCIVESREGDANLSITPSALKLQFGIEIPKKASAHDTRGIVHQLGSKAIQQAGGWEAIGESAKQSLADFGSKVSELGSLAWGAMYESLNSAEPCKRPCQQPASPMVEEIDAASMLDVTPSAKLPDLSVAFSARHVSL